MILFTSFSPPPSLLQCWRFANSLTHVSGCNIDQEEWVNFGFQTGDYFDLVYMPCGNQSVSLSQDIVGVSQGLLARIFVVLWLKEPVPDKSRKIFSVVSEKNYPYVSHVTWVTMWIPVPKFPMKIHGEIGKFCQEFKISVLFRIQSKYLASNAYFLSLCVDLLLNPSQRA